MHLGPSLYKDSAKEHILTVAKDARISCDGKECKLEDRKKGAKVKVTTEGKGEKAMATKIEGRPNKPANKPDALRPATEKRRALLLRPKPSAGFVDRKVVQHFSLALPGNLKGANRMLCQDRRGTAKGARADRTESTT